MLPCCLPAALQGLVSLWSSRMRVVPLYPLYPALHRPAPLYWYSRVGAAIIVTGDTSELVTFALRAISAYLCLAPCSTLHNSLRNKVSSVQQLLLLIGSLQPRHALRQFLRIFKWQTTEIISKENGINDNVSQFQFLLKLVTDFFVSLVWFYKA